MTGPRLGVIVDARSTFERLRRLTRAAADLRPVLAGPVNTSINDFLVKRFDTEGAFGGQPWKPLSPVTIELRKRRGLGRGGILRSSNRLWASLTKLGVGPDAIKNITPHTIERGTLVPYAAAHQTGYTAKLFGRGQGRAVPARPIVPDPIPSSISDEWIRMIEQFMLQGAS